MALRAGWGGKNARSRGRGGRSGLRRFAPLALVGLALVAAGWTALASTALTNADRGDPRLALIVTPSAPSVNSRRAFHLAQAGISFTPPMVQRLRDDLRLIPLGDGPFLAMATVRQHSSSPPNLLPDGLLAEALRRDPRSEAARSLLVVREANAGRIEEAIAQIGHLLRIESSLRQPVIAILAAAAALPRTRSSVVELIGEDEALRLMLVRTAAEQGAEPEVLAFLIPADGATLEETGILAQRLIERGRYSEAADLAAPYLEGSPRRSLQDPRFEGAARPAPFYWMLPSHDAGSAGSDSEGGLVVQYHQAGPAGLAEQTLLLQPGPYRLLLEGQLDTEIRGEPLVWQVRCTGGATLAELALPQPDEAGAVEQEFSVPADCPVQIIQLLGRPLEFPETVVGRVRSLEIVR